MTGSVRSVGITGYASAIMAASRIAFLLVGIASTAVILTSTVVPYSADLLLTSLPRIRILALAWLSPPYLFVTVHFIIIVIWKLQGNNYMQHPLEEKDENEQVVVPYRTKSSDVPDAIPPITTVTSASNPPDFAPTVFALSDFTPTPPDFALAPPDFAQALPDNASDPAEPSRTAPEEAHDSMDATWKAILEGVAGAASSAARPRMRKSDTWERRGADREHFTTATLQRRFRKSETFRRVSVGREELFGRAEAFIRTQYEQRRIQRQESEQRYIEMVNAAC